MRITLLFALVSLGCAFYNGNQKKAEQFRFLNKYVAIESNRVKDFEDEESKIIITPLNDIEFLTFNISLGSPPQNFTMLFMIDLPVMILPSANCNTTHCLNFNTYNHTESSTYVKDGRIYNNKEFGISGTLSKDIICFQGGGCFQHTFVETDFFATNFDAIDFDGFIGLKLFPKALDVPSFVSELAHQKKIIKQMVAVWVNWNPDSQNLGEIAFGGVDEKRFFEPIVWKDMFYNTSFFKMDKIEFNHEIFVSCANGCEVSLITDKGIAGPAKEIQKIHKLINASCSVWRTGCDVSCKMVPNFPKLSFVIGGETFDMAPQQYVYRVGTKCYTMFYQNGENKWIFGNTFSNSFYTVFDLDNKKIGFAYNDPE